MQNAINLLMLLCAILGSLAFGVLSAYALCRLGFFYMRRHAAHTQIQAHQAPLQPQQFNISRPPSRAI